jgi:hypothetical protein
VKPSINAIETTQTVVKVVRSPGFQRTLPGCDRVLPIIGMNRITGSPILQIFERPAKVFLHSFVDELELAARCHDSYQRRNAIHERRKFTSPLRDVLIEFVCDPLRCA